MRFFFLLSGFVGFVLVGTAGLSAGRAPDLVLRDAALGCIIAAFAGRWFWRVLQQAAVQTAAARRAAAEAQAEAEAAAAEAAAPRPAPTATASAGTTPPVPSTSSRPPAPAVSRAPALATASR